MNDDQKKGDIVSLPSAERSVDLDGADKTVIRALIRRCLINDEDLQEVLAEVFRGRPEPAVRDLVLNGGLFDALRVSARSRIRGQ